MNVLTFAATFDFNAPSQHHASGLVYCGSLYSPYYLAFRLKREMKYQFRQENQAAWKLIG